VSVTKIDEYERWAVERLDLLRQQMDSGEVVAFAMVMVRNHQEVPGMTLHHMAKSGEAGVSVTKVGDCKRCDGTGYLPSFADIKLGHAQPMCECNPLYLNGAVGTRMEHEESEHCWCEPDVERYDGGDVIIHRRTDH
jgi:hypothetical protein